MLTISSENGGRFWVLIRRGFLRHCRSRLAKCYKIGGVLTERKLSREMTELAMDRTELVDWFCRRIRAVAWWLHDRDGLPMRLPSIGRRIV